MTRNLLLAGVAAGTLLIQAPALAQAVAAAPPVGQPVDDDGAPQGNAAAAHPDKHDEENAIVITGNRARTPDVLGGVAVLDKEEMVHDLKPGLGDMLADMPGVSASSFGPSSSRPILRGEQGDRAPILIDGISTLDLSTSDPDHAVTINPLTAERIELLHGPGALIYAPSAIGGVVNITDGRIPRRVPDHVSGDVLLNYGSAANDARPTSGSTRRLGAISSRMSTVLIRSMTTFTSAAMC